MEIFTRLLNSNFFFRFAYQQKRPFFLFFLLSSTWCSDSFAQSQIFTSSGIFTVPSGVTSIKVEAWGGGGGGGSYGGRNRPGGGGGAYASSVLPVIAGNTYIVAVGTGGLPGSAGTNSSFNNTSVIAAGGSSNNSDYTGGIGGTAAASTGTIKFSGASGGSASNSNSDGGGGGGGSAFFNSNGNTGGPGNSSTGGLGGTGTGNGGNGGMKAANGINGNAPGGAGSGLGSGAAISGSGASGQVTVSWPTFNFAITSGCVAGTITLSGTNLLGATSVKIGGIAVSIISNTSSQIVATIANGPSGTVAVVTSHGSATSTGIFTVNALPMVNAGSTINAICQNGTTTALGGSFGGSATAAVWSDGDAGGSFTDNAGSTPGAATYTASATSTSSVTLTLTTIGGSCGSVTSSKTLTVKPNSTVNVGVPLAAICQGGTTSALDGSFGGGATSGIWSDGGAGGSFTNNSGTAPGTATYTASATSGTSVTLTLAAAGDCSTAIASKVLTVNEKIVITSEPGPATQTVCSGSTVTYSVNAAGTGPLTYQWYKGSSMLSDDGIKISGAQAATLKLLLVNASNSTTPGNEYYVKVSSSAVCNPVISSIMSLTVNTGIDITSQPSTQTVCEGTSATFTALAEGTGPFTVQWFKGSNLISTGVNTVNTSATSITTTLTLSGVTVADQATNYYVIIKNVSDVCPTEVSNQASLVINRNSSLHLNTSVATTAQTVCINNAISSVSYSIGGDASGASAGTLPAGLISTYNGGVLTISGTPTSAGTFDYTVTTTGSCINPSLSGTIIVKPNPTITLTSTSGTKDQTVCVNSPLIQTSYTIANGGTGASITAGSLPAGVTGSFNAGVFTITGTPTITGSFTYTLTTTGPCINSSIDGTIIVKPAASISLTSSAASKSQSLCINTVITPVTYSIAGGGIGATFSGLPAGVSGTYIAGVARIEGKPTVAGSFNYTINTTGTCLQVSASGSFTVSPATLAGTLSPARAIGCKGTASGTITLSGSTGSILRWEVSSNAGHTWTAIPNTLNATTFNYSNLNQTTIYRAVIQSGSCGLAYSAISIIVVDPPYTPKIVATPAITCIGQPVTLTAIGYQSLGTLTGGNFDEANPAGWSGSNANNNNQAANSAWGEASGPKTFNDVTYNSTSKFMIVNGTTGLPNNVSMLSSPAFSTVGLTSFSLTWRQAYNLNAGAVAKVEISIDGGANYTTLETYTGPDNLDPTNGLTDAAINLDAYLGQTNIKVRFNYTGSAQSNWAIDDVNMTQTYWPLNYTWSPAPGLSSTSGATVTYTPSVSGIIDLEVFTTTNSSCPGAGTGTVRVTVNPSPTLAGISIPPVCIGSNLVVNLSGLIPNTTSSLTYQIGSGVITTVTDVVADASGNALFSAPATISNNGQTLTITSISSRTTANNVICSLVPASNNSSPISVIKDYVWTGSGVGNLWTTVANWNICGVPPDGSSVTIPDVSPKHFPKLNVDFFTSNNFDLLGNATIDLNGLTLELGITTASVINTQGKIIGSKNSNLTIQGACTTLTFDQTAPGSTNALLNFKVNSSGQTVELGNPLWVVGNVFPIAGIIASGGNLTMVSTETTSSNITAFASPSADVEGDVNVQSYITGDGADLVNRGFRSMSSPINDLKITGAGARKTFRQMKDYIIITGPGGVTNGFDQGGAAQPYAETITLYNETAPAFAPSSPSIATIDQAQVPGTGFLAFFRGSQGVSYANNATKLNAPFVTPDPVTITYRGPINKFDVPAITLNYTNNAGDVYNGYNLVGNPYPSAIDWTEVYSRSTGGVVNSFIIVLPGGKQASYLDGICNNISNTTTATIIQPCQGFYVRASAPGATISFKESSKSTFYPNRLLTMPQTVLMSTGPLVFGGSDKVSSAARIVRMNLQDGINTEETTLVFKEDGAMQAGFEDALYFTGGSLTLASLSSDNKRMAINGLPDLEEVKEVRLNVNSTNGGPVKLKFTDLSQTKGYEVFLKDSVFAGQLIDAKKKPVYEFVIDKSKPETFGNFRLSILFKKEEIFPLTLKAFIAKKQQNEEVELSWVIVATGVSKEFEIERSTDGKTFHTIGSVRSQGNSQGNEKYFFIDKEPAQGINYYRVRQINLNGRICLSEIKTADNSSLNGLSLTSLLVYPNPVLGEFEAKLNQTLNEPVELSIYDVHGAKVLNMNFSATELWRYNIGKLEPSIYILEVKSTAANKLVGRTKFVKGI